MIRTQNFCIRFPEKLILGKENIERKYNINGETEFFFSYLDMELKIWEENCFETIKLSLHPYIFKKGL